MGGVSEIDQSGGGRGSAAQRSAFSW